LICGDVLGLRSVTLICLLRFFGMCTIIFVRGHDDGCDSLLDRGGSSGNATTSMVLVVKNNGCRSKNNDCGIVSNMYCEGVLFIQTQFEFVIAAQ